MPPTGPRGPAWGSRPPPAPACPGHAHMRGWLTGNPKSPRRPLLPEAPAQRLPAESASVPRAAPVLCHPLATSIKERLTPECPPGVFVYATGSAHSPGPPTCCPSSAQRLPRCPPPPGSLGVIRSPRGPARPEPPAATERCGSRAELSRLRGVMAWRGGLVWVPGTGLTAVVSRAELQAEPPDPRTLPAQSGTWGWPPHRT